jgi:hypothetical protein
MFLPPLRGMKVSGSVGGPVVDRAGKGRVDPLVLTQTDRGCLEAETGGSGRRGASDVSAVS